MTSKVCTRCKEIKPVAEFSKHSSREDGLQPCCKVCNKEYRSKPEVEQRRKEYSKEYYKGYYTNPKARFSSARRQAAGRSLPFTLTLEQYMEAITPECAYCDGFFGKVIQGTGLDRLDNSRGYEPGNIVSCCKTCNQVRMDILTSEETRAAVQAVIALRKQGEAS